MTKQPKRRDYFFISRESDVHIGEIIDGYYIRNSQKSKLPDGHVMKTPEVKYSNDVFRGGIVGAITQLRDPESELRKTLKSNRPDAFYIEDRFPLTQYKEDGKISENTIFPEGLPSNPRLQLEKLVKELKKCYPKIPVIGMTISDSFGYEDEEQNKPHAERESIMNSKEVDANLHLDEYETDDHPRDIESALATAKAKIARSCFLGG